MPALPFPFVIGVGNTFRRDDGVGIWVAQRLREQLPRGVCVLEATGEGAALLEAWKETSSVVLVDAARSGDRPGTIHRFDAAVKRVPSIFSSASTHSFGVGEAIELARALHQLPARFVIYGIEGENFEQGIGLSSVVMHSAAEVTRLVLNEVLAPNSLSYQ